MQHEVVTAATAASTYPGHTKAPSPDRSVKLSIVIPCYNEEKTLELCVSRVLAIRDATLELEIIIVDDCSKDNSLDVARRIMADHLGVVVVLKHEVNQGKGAALRTGFARATGDFVAVQDADLEYNPMDLKKLLVPLRKGEADVVLGSRFLSSETHRVLYFWHSVGNRFLTLLSNMLTDLNLSDMETCYKVFRREVIQSIEIQENRFGFEPEVVAKIAQKRLRVYEMGVSYHGRTYAEGKKIGMRDGWRALYCILKYNLPTVPIPVQFSFYILIGAFSAIVNLICFLILLKAGVDLTFSALSAFFVAAFVNYLLSITFLFRHKAKWSGPIEIAVYFGLVIAVAIFDVVCTHLLIGAGLGPALAKILAAGIGLIFNYAGRRFIVFPEKTNPDWKPSTPD